MKPHVVAIDYGQARFVLALMASGVACVALFTGYLTGGQWLAAQGTILGLYSAHSVLDDKIPDRNFQHDALTDHSPGT